MDGRGAKASSSRGFSMIRRRKGAVEDIIGFFVFFFCWKFFFVTKRAYSLLGRSWENSTRLQGLFFLLVLGQRRKRSRFFFCFFFFVVTLRFGIIERGNGNSRPFLSQG